MKQSKKRERNSERSEITRNRDKMKGKVGWDETDYRLVENRESIENGKCRNGFSVGGWKKE